MFRFGKRLSNSLILMIGAACCFAGNQNTAMAQPSSADTPPSWLKDVELTDVFFLDAQLGWAVGEHGTVLRTTNAGKTWTNTANLQQVLDRDRQIQGELGRVLNTLERNLGEQSAPKSRMVSTGINFRFESVHFSDSKNGLVVGGYDVPYLKRSRAVVMRTADGGASWQIRRGLVIPRLTKVRMDNEFATWALGDSSNLHRAGIFSSSDGGISWSSQASQVAGSFRDAARTGQSLVAVNSAGSIEVIRGQESEPAVIMGVQDPKPINAVTMIDPKSGWAVGHSGQILRTRDGGMSWRLFQAAELQTESKFDFGTMTIAHGKLWVAGNPGTYLMSIDLTNGQLSRHRTPVASAINAIVFPTPMNGWAVGDGGTILCTKDGGQTWQVQRSATKRVALLAVSFDLQSVPFTSLVQYAGENDYVTASVHVSLDGRSEMPGSLSRLQQATSRVGCNTCRVIYPETSDIVRQLTLSIRALKPTAIICESPPVRDSQELIDPYSLLQKAIVAAADRYQFSDQLVELGLSTWQVDRLAVYDSAGQGELKTNSDRFLPFIGQTIEDFSAVSFALLGLPMSQGEQKSFLVKQFGLSRGFRGSDLLDGIRQFGRQVPSRSDSGARRGNLQTMQRNVSRIEQMKVLAQWQDLSPNSLLVWRQKLNSIIVGQDSDLSGVWLARLAGVYMKTGEWQMAAVTLNQLVARYQEHPLAPAAMLWLAQYHASDEMLADRIRINEEVAIPESDDDLMAEFNVKPANFQSSAQVVQADGMTHMVWVPEKVRQEVDNELLASGLPTPKIDPVTEAYQQASSIIARVRAGDPDLAHDQHLRFLEAKLTGRVQSSLAAENLFQQLVRKGAPGEPVFVASGREIQLVKTKGKLSSGYACSKISDRPELDGDLSDNCWSKIMNQGHSQFFRMTPPGERSASKTDVVMFAYDEEFLYIAARVNKLSNYPYRNSDATRERDADLRNRDRVEFAVDTDRDYKTYLQFSVDHRGWCADGANGSQGWDPEWYVAQADDEKSWTIEIAIPVAQLTSSKIDETTIWGVSAARKMGRRSVNLWPTRNLDFENEDIGLHRVSELPAESFELIQFEL